MTTHSGDFRIESHGSVWGFTPLNDDARHFVRVAVETESWQWMGNSLILDHRVAVQFREQLIEEGFSLV